MNPSKTIWLLFFLGFLFSSIYAQNNPNKRPASRSPQLNSEFPDTPSPDVSVAGILRHSTTPGEKGGMYMNNEWMDGKLILNDGSEINDWKYRYNIRYDQMQYYDGKDTFAFAKPSEIKFLQLQNGKTFVVEAYTRENTIDTSYFELIRDGKNRLLYRRVITAHLEDQNDRTDDDFLHNDVWYVKFGDKPARPVFLNKRCMMNIFGDKSEKIKTFIKENHIKCKSKDDLIAVFEYYNTLDADEG